MKDIRNFFNLAFYLLSFPAGKRITKKDEIESIHWSTWTCVLGEEVNGIWEKYTDTTDVNAAEANFQHGVIVTGDDFGQVKLVRFPCIKKGSHISASLNVRLPDYIST